AAVRLRDPVREDLYRFVDTVEQGEGSTATAMEVGYSITDTWDDLRRTGMTRLYKEPESTGGDKGFASSRPQATGTVHT
nr:hypothetical protein [Tanacetum cinerariifolium]